MRKAIYANQPWYRKRPEPEETYTGVLVPANAPSGPGGRPSPLFAFRMEGRELPVYTEGVERELQPLAGRRVWVQGKVIDFQRSGFSPELWIGVIEEALSEG